jgi:hypothetical protein
MGLTAPSSTLTGQAVADSYDQLLFLDAAAGVTEATLKVVSGTAGKTALQVSDEHVLIKGVDTSNAAAFAVQQTGGTVVFSVNASTPGVTIGADADGTDRSITWGHSTLKTIMGIDDSADVFAINTDDAFESGNDLEIDASGNVIIGNGTLKPAGDGTQDLGASGAQWQNVYTSDLNLNNTSRDGNEVDGTTGHWVIQEGDENLFLLNRQNGKQYKFNLEEIG